MNQQNHTELQVGNILKDAELKTAITIMSARLSACEKILHEMGYEKQLQVNFTAFMDDFVDKLHKHATDRIDSLSKRIDSLHFDSAEEGGVQ
jgi:hypothetical protein